MRSVCCHFAIVTVGDDADADNVNDGSSLTIQFFSVCHLRNDLNFRLCSVNRQPIDMLVLNAFHVQK